jgi:hypothetical protein
LSFRWFIDGLRICMYKCYHGVLFPKYFQFQPKIAVDQVQFLRFSGDHNILCRISTSITFITIRSLPSFNLSTRRYVRFEFYFHVEAVCIVRADGTENYFLRIIRISVVCPTLRLKFTVAKPKYVKINYRFGERKEFRII